jgi:hypothetical protein
MLRQDWTSAYAALHRDSRKGCSAEQFARRATAYRQNLRLEPDAVRVRSCEEHGDEAVAHVVVTGRSGPEARSYKDAITLRRDDTGWAIVLPPNFGR